MPPPTVTSDEDIAIISAFQVTADALRRIRIALEQELDACTDPQTANELGLQLNEVMEQISDNDRDFDDYLAGNLALVAPKQEELDAVVQNAAQVAALTTQKTTAEALVSMATHAADLLHAATT